MKIGKGRHEVESDIHLESKTLGPPQSTLPITVPEVYFLIQAESS
jgi:hypothetical protein